MEILNDEFQILNKIKGSMGEVVNAEVGKVFTIESADTLSIIQRRLQDCDLKHELELYGEIFTKKKGVTIDDIAKSEVSFLRVLSLIKSENYNFDMSIYENLLGDLQIQVEKLKNIIHLTKVSASATGDFKSGELDLVGQKNERIKQELEEEILNIKEKMKNYQPTVKNIEPEKDKNSENDSLEKENRKFHKVEKKSDKKKSDKSKVDKNKEKSSLFGKLLKPATTKQETFKEIKEDEFYHSKTRCREIPYLQEKLVFTKSKPCRDIPEFTLYRKKELIFFGRTDLAKKRTYNNQSGELLELTKANEEFYLCMTEDVENLKKLEISEETMLMYFEFMNFCFEKYMGNVLSANEYVQFKETYNVLIAKYYLECQKQQQIYCDAMRLVDEYLIFIKCFLISEECDRQELIRQMLNHETDLMLQKLKEIKEEHMVTELVLNQVDMLMNDIAKFHIESDENARDTIEEAIEEAIEETIEKQSFVSEEKAQDGGVRDVRQIAEIIGTGRKKKKKMQVIVQVLDTNYKILDEAVYAKENIMQALYDLNNKNGKLKRIGIRSEDKEIFFDN